MSNTADTSDDGPYAPRSLRSYALLADGERGALVGPHGEYAWMCAPHWDSGGVFAGLIGGRGEYSVTPTGRFVPGGYYEEGSLIWHSRWVTEKGVAECREALAFPGDPRRTVILRQITALDHTARLRVRLAPVSGFGDHRAGELHRDDHGVWTCRSAGLRFRWTGGADARVLPSGDGWELDLTVRPGAPHDLVLEVGDGEPPAGPRDATHLWRETEAAWRREVPALPRTLGERDARQAYAVLRGLTGRSGGMVAAATMSLPERAREGRNYDYRYVWIRDQCYAGQAVAAAGALPLLDDAVRFVTARVHEDGPGLAPAYTTRGRSIPDQHRLDLPGYPGGYDVVGNRVTQQFQLDAFGEVLLLLAAAARHDRLDGDGWKAAELTAGAIADRWHEPDAGVWELAPRHWTHSRLACAAGLRAIVAAGAPGRHAGRWNTLADTLVAAAGRDGEHPSGRWQRSPDDPGLDGALLLPAIRGAVPEGDPRTAETLRAYLTELTDDHYAYRFRHDERPLAEAEGAFLMCGFVVALAEQRQGHRESALRWFERNRAACGTTGLFSEEYDVAQREMRGNLPQAFVHALMLECAARLADPSATA
ncbi:glycoside hydrolase family 15 protein [Streptomyces sp. NPDC096310]|uniref:glycoside hydrolase family 15 protein n=1 Tax=Streptomyces sp. NPDC096310 TaxID=3366082 RepID=UPI0037FC9994